MHESVLRQESALAESLSSISWKVSETIFETQRLVIALLEFEEGFATRDDVILASEILWSRVEVLSESELQNHPTLQGIADQLNELLLRYEGPIYDAPRLDHAITASMGEDLVAAAKDIRSLWISEFLLQSHMVESSTMNQLTQRRQMVELWMLGCIIALGLYMGAELLVSRRAHKRERELRQAAMAANEAKTEFLANVSHEVRTPLNGVIGMAQELSETEMTQDQRALVEVILSSGNLLLTTINDVLDLSKVESGRIELETCVFDLPTTLEQALKVHEGAARAKGLDLALTVEVNVPKWVDGDPLRLTQVVNNLVSNAIKFTESGRVRLRIEGRPDASKPRTKFRLEVSDTGQGISHRAQEKIFRPFTQEDNSTSRRHGGTGLGLTISRRICRLMGGDLTVFSKPGSGSVFTANFQLAAPDAEAIAEAKAAGSAPMIPPKAEVKEPAAKPATQSPAQQTPVGNAAHGPRVLLVDDSAINRMVITRFIGGSCRQLTEVSNGREAVEAALTQDFDLILMDIQMPEMDGMEATRHIRAYEQSLPDTPHVPIYAITANVMSHQIESYIENGVDGVVSKPVKKNEVLGLLHSSAGGAAA
ncbi:response regulator [Alphaproteobacteria bacterium KMM 3653]|uniref:Sensory/regulatory protein RpfC n=1 Tax=Harenicola maris TaxID=2841044 RepID=A0AAP2G9U9_9RHOB|nr:response regulator [Harenicola maris]